MTTTYTLSLTETQHSTLKILLFPGDNKESVAIALCGQRAGNRRHKLMIREIHAIPDSACEERSALKVRWNTDLLSPILEHAEATGMAVVKFHSHPGGYPQFSETDDEGDNELLTSIRGWTESKAPVGSVVMLPEGQLFGRVLSTDNTLVPLEVISVVGDDIHFWYANNGSKKTNNFCASHAQLFGSGTTERLQKLSVAVVGCSGTGSPLVEQLARLGVGELILIDHDKIEERNINRIYNSTIADAKEGRMKVDVLAENINRIGLGTRVIALPYNLWTVEAVNEVAQCDVVFGCMDGADGRYLLNTLSTYYTIPYFDVGIRLEAEPSGLNKGRINEVCGAVHYLQPGKSSLMSRGVFSMQRVRVEGLLRNDPKAHAQEKQDGYISGVEEHRPAVISVNSLAASLVVNELLGRIHPYREEGNDQYAQIFFSLSSMEIIYETDDLVCKILCDKVGIGDVDPPLGQMELIIPKKP